MFASAASCCAHYCETAERWRPRKQLLLEPTRRSKQNNRGASNTSTVSIITLVMTEVVSGRNQIGQMSAGCAPSFHVASVIRLSNMEVTKQLQGQVLALPAAKNPHQVRSVQFRSGRTTKSDQTRSPDHTTWYHQDKTPCSAAFPTTKNPWSMTPGAGIAPCLKHGQEHRIHVLRMVRYSCHFNCQSRKPGSNSPPRHKPPQSMYRGEQAAYV